MTGKVSAKALSGQKIMNSSDSNAPESAVNGQSEISLEIYRDDISLDTQHLIGAIAKLKALEEELPLINTVNEVEERRLYCQAIHTIMERKLSKNDEISEWVKTGKELALWSGRVAMMCMRRIGQIRGWMQKNKGGRPARKTLLTDSKVSKEPTNKELGLDKNEARDVQALASISEPEFKAALDAQMKAGKINKTALIAEARSRRSPVKKGDKNREDYVELIIEEYEAKGKKIDERHARKLASQRLSKARTQGTNPRLREKIPVEAQALHPNFRRCWIQIQKLLEVQISTSELTQFQTYLFEAFVSYREDQEKISAQRELERQRQKAVTELKKGL